MIRIRTAVVLAIGTLTFAAPHKLHAQNGVVEGTTVTEGTQRPLSGVQISVDGVAGKGAVSDASGRFRITGLSGASIVLDVRALGFRPVKDTVRVGATNIRISL
ncbi:MAG: carboxypeptidase regulatory-like domain-containing protein, partial [Gemmatimonadaceae bacterium]